jgi:hypothetical protein
MTRSYNHQWTEGNEHHYNLNTADAKYVPTLPQNDCGSHGVFCGLLILIMSVVVLLFQWLIDHSVAPGVAKCLKQPKILCSLLFWILLLQAQAVANS